MFRTPKRRVRRLAGAVVAVVVAGCSWLPAAVAAPAHHATSSVGSESAAAAATVGSPGYWMAASDGGVYAFGTANLGQVRPQPLNEPVVAVAAYPTGSGYWMVAADGGIFDYGAARYYGSTGAVHLNKPIVGMAATPDGRGYWLVAADGGIFDFGDAHFYGSTGDIHLNKPIVGMAATPDGRGYWLVASDGGIFDFGDAHFYGSTGNVHLNKPVVGMAATVTGGGYWLVASDGGIFDFGNASFQGSTGNVALNKPIVGMAASPTGGYWLVASDGGLFDFGGAPFLGSAGGAPGPAPIVGIAATDYGAQYPPGAIGTDISWPQCGRAYPAPGNPVSIVGVNDGTTFSDNPCFASEAANAGTNLTVYINLNQVTPGDPRAMRGPAGDCATSDLICQGYNWGAGSAAASIDYAHSFDLTPHVWWLDIEAPCGHTYAAWMCGASGQASNAAVIAGALNELRSNGLIAGIYSTYEQWPEITGGSENPNGTYTDKVTYPGIPTWIATVPPSVAAWPSYCTAPTYQFAGGKAWLVQWLGGSNPPTAPYDGDYACPL